MSKGYLLGADPKNGGHQPKDCLALLINKKRIINLSTLVANAVVLGVQRVARAVLHLRRFLGFFSNVHVSKFAGRWMWDLLRALLLRVRAYGGFLALVFAVVRLYLRLFLPSLLGTKHPT